VHGEKVKRRKKNLLKKEKKKKPRQGTGFLATHFYTIPYHPVSKPERSELQKGGKTQRRRKSRFRHHRPARLVHPLQYRSGRPPGKNDEKEKEKEIK